MKVGVYTCVVGGYDHVREPVVMEDECDYYLISDDASLAGTAWRWIDVNSLVPDVEMSPKDKNRYCKMHPHKIFSDYDYSVYLDGSIQVVEPVIGHLDKVGKTGIAAHRHRADDCVYTEAIFLSWLGAVDPELERKNLERYIIEGFPRHFGLFECGILVTDLRNQLGMQLYKEWYKEYLQGVKRDQQALMYSLWKLGLDSSAIGDIGKGYNIFTNPAFSWDRSAHYK